MTKIDDGRSIKLQFLNYFRKDNNNNNENNSFFSFSKEVDESTQQSKYYLNVEKTKKYS